MRPMSRSVLLVAQLAPPSTLVAARLNLALLCSRTGDPSGALDSYRHVLRTRPAHAVAWNGVGAVLAAAQEVIGELQ